MWVIESDYPGINGVFVPYAEREYSCTGCGSRGSGWTLTQQSPPAFLLQPHAMYPMTRADFAYWLRVLRTNFPDHPRLAEPSGSFFPRTPGGVLARLWNRMANR
jgi:hypothetical protein